MSFWITVYRNPDEEERNVENILASWEGSLHRWVDALDDLMKAGKLTQTRSDYFPSLYRGLARDLLPILPANRKPRYSIHFTPEMLQERFDRCPPDAELGIMIWDMG
ncbi:hypothetical protein [Pseudomonas sp. GWSMS-1]|uniref:hypothetical protein n=1 Tax=Pseudomonas sp. GWSMS-1 TaxID=3308997 RepID=UPI003CEAC37B